MGKKNIYKKSLAMSLVREGFDLIHTMRNWNDPKWNVFVFEDSPEFRRALAELTGRTYEED